MIDGNPAASFPDFLNFSINLSNQDIWYKPIKSGAQPKDCSIATRLEGKENTQAVTWPVVKPMAEHSEQRSTFKGEEETMHSLCFYHIYLMAGWIGVFL